MQLKDGILLADLLSELPIHHGFSTRQLGNLGFGKFPNDPEVVANREKLFRSQGLEGRILIQPRQVHSDRAVSGSEFQPGCEADASYSQEKRDLLSVLTADCVPILVALPDGYVAAIHAGWRGLQEEIIPKTLARLPKGGRAAIGPAIGPCCYEVGEELAKQFETKFGSSVVSWKHPKPHLDLPRIASLQLDQAGIEEWETAHLCTSCHPDLFFSFRRDGSSGRMMSFIGL
jgi:purine-nucleoside/S-methyl-5'-thioadenosine phosphorylase / adenosine deaminase